ncbi:MULTISPECIES: hypothetical protein [Streptomyces]|uniref:DUF3558 domain-containing protein n=2 Tax=Streptomyces TaxID=1883 RepID=A0A2U9P465_STRAS|nr:hypothetical protein [Streptomyces actuosus]AWT43961.1 hypothetical protein DMT42_17645 [Streptomyces actuosus]MBM4820900.1 hypothetical protein [Streptomyces actuosus]
MTPRRVGRGGTRALVAAVTAGVLAVGVAGCGDSGDRAVPGRVCGVPVDADALAPLLPDDGKVADRRTDKGGGSVSCRVSVNGSPVLHLAGDVTDPGTGARAVSLADRGLGRLGNPALVEGAGDTAAVADRGAKAAARCTWQGRDHDFVGLVQLEGEDPVPAGTEDRRDALLAFLKSWFPAAARAQGCTPGSGGSGVS